MAKGKYQKLYEARMKRLGKGTDDDLQRQINNYKARLEAGGVENPEADDRNSLERLLNLRQNQGIIRDVFEILGRPQQAVFTGIKNSQEGGSFLEGMKEGITGNDETQFKDILMNTGNFEDEKGKIDAVDVLGLAGDMFLDPMNLPVAGFGKVGKALDAGDNIFKAMRHADSLDNLVFKAAGKGIKGGAKLADTGIERGLKYLDETKGVYDKAGNLVKLKYANAGAKRGSDLLALDAATGKALDGATGLLQKYKTAKNQITDAFKLPKGALDAILRRRSADASAYTAKAQSAAKIKEIQEKAEAFTKATNGKYGDATEFINNAYALLNSTTNRTYNVDELLELAKKGELPGYEEVIEPFKKVLDRDVPAKVRKEIEEKLGKDAFEVAVDKHNNIKLGKGWYEVEFDKSTSSIADEISLLQSQYDELDVPLKELIEKGIHPLDAEMEMDNISAKIQELRSKELDSKVTLKRRYTPEQEQLLSNLSQAYGHNVDGYRDAVDSIFGTAWKKQDSGIMSNPRGIISDGTFDENGEEIYRQLDPINLSKNQALVMDPDELYTGRGSNKDIIKPMTADKQLGTVANTKFYTDNPNMAIGYGGETPATPYNLGAEGVYHRGMLPKTNEENVLAIGPNGAYDDGEFGYVYQPDPTYDWTNIPYRNKDSYEAFKQLGEKDVDELLKISQNSADATEFLKNVKSKGSKRLKDNLKKHKIDINSIDRPSGTAHYSSHKVEGIANSAKNINNADALYLFGQEWNGILMTEGLFDPSRPHKTIIKDQIDTLSNWTNSTNRKIMSKVDKETLDALQNLNENNLEELAYLSTDFLQSGNNVVNGVLVNSGKFPGDAGAGEGFLEFLQKNASTELMENLKKSGILENGVQTIASPYKSKNIDSDTLYDILNSMTTNNPNDNIQNADAMSKFMANWILSSGGNDDIGEFLNHTDRIKQNLKGVDVDDVLKNRLTYHLSENDTKELEGIMYRAIKDGKKDIDGKTLLSYIKKYGSPDLKENLSKSGLIDFNHNLNNYKYELETKFMPTDTGGGYNTDEVVEQIYKNQATGRASSSYNTVEMRGIKDNIAGGEEGSDIITFDPGDGSLPRNFKSIYNKTPMLESESIYDIAENSKEAVKGGVDIFNDVIDDALGTKMGTKYHYLTNSDYVASNILTDDGANIIDEFNEFRGMNKSVGNTKLLSSRKYLTTPEETNNFIREYINKVPDKELKDYPELLKFKHNKDAKFMETDYIKSLTNRYVDDKGYSNLASQSKVVSQTLLDNSFKDFDKTLAVQKKMEVEYKTKGAISEKLINEYNKSMENSVIKPLTSFDNKVPNGYVKVTSSDLEDFIRKHSTISGQLGKDDNAEQLRKLLQKVIGSGNDVAINEDVWRTIGAAFEAKNVNALSQIYNSYLNTFKMWKTASPTNTLNALIGNTSNLMLGGVSMADQAKFGPKVLDIMQNGEKYYLQRLSGTQLDEASQEIADLWFEFKQLGFGDASLDLSGLPDDVKDLVNKKKSLKGTKDYITKGLPTLFGSINQKMDTVSRLTIMLKAKSDPGFLKHLGVDDVYGAISKIMFDPTVLTSTEKKIKQILPFYTYAKNNLVYQVTNLPRNANKYSRLMKGMNSLQKSATGNNEENMADYLKDSLYIPIPVLGKDGNYKVLRANLPFGQLIETIEDPKQSLVNMLSPAIKAPIEYATGIDSFTGREIEKFPGERSTQIPFLTKKQQKFISDFSGLDVPLKNAVRIGEGAVEGNIGKGILNTVTMTNNIDTDRISKQYEELNALQNMMKQYKQEGYEFSTMTELRRANKNNKISELEAIFAKYGLEE